MSRTLAYSTIEAVIDRLRSALGEGLLSVYLYGSLSDGTYQADQSDINLVALVADPVAVHQVRKMLRAGVWAKYGQTLRQTPLVATPRQIRAAAPS
jgi:predicted nucleotidyltransferase